MTHYNHGDSLTHAQPGDTITNGYGEHLTVLDITPGAHWLICEQVSGRRVRLKRDTTNRIGGAF